MKFEGQQFRVTLQPRGSTAKDNHVTIVIESEDDGSWFEFGSFSSFWLPDLFRVLRAAEDHMKKHCRRGKWGYTFKAREREGGTT